MGFIAGAVCDKIIKINDSGETVIMYIAIMGYGVVGSGVAEVINKNHDSIVRKRSRSLR